MFDLAEFRRVIGVKNGETEWTHVLTGAKALMQKKGLFEPLETLNDRKSRNRKMLDDREDDGEEKEGAR